MKQFITRVLTHKCIAGQYYEVTFPWQAEAGIPLPGQFFSIRVSQNTVPLLRRPFAFAYYHQTTGRAALIFEVRGKGTQLLAGKKAGDELDIAGPFGNCFVECGDGKLPVLVAGGIGLGPMLFFARRLQEKGQEFRFIYGCRREALLPDSAEFRAVNPEICTDDGSAGFKGTTVQYLASLPEGVLRKAAVYGCGPFPMLRGCSLFAETRGLDCQVSLDEIMACSLGACMGCVVRIKGEARYARVCKEGPVFDSREIIWD